MKATLRALKVWGTLSGGSLLTDTLRQAIDTFNARLNDAETFLFITRDSAQQQARLADLRKLDVEAETVKARLVKENNEFGANLMLAFQCVADSYAQEIEMWLALKEGRHEVAWDHLIGAQEANDAVLRLGIPFGAIIPRGERLLILEKLVFPPQTFMSAGCIVNQAACSICGDDYDTCGHVAGRAYWGQFASIVPSSFRGDHVAMVDAPADKRCRAIVFSDEGKARNKMTWVLSEQPLPENMFQGILMSGGARWGRVRFDVKMLSEPTSEMIGRPVTGGRAIEMVPITPAPQDLDADTNRLPPDDP